MNTTIFEDKMYIKTGVSGKELLRAIKKFGIFEKKMKEAHAIIQKKNEEIME